MSKLFQEKKITIIIYVIILFFSGCVTTKTSLAHLEANLGDDCTLDFESGINDIVVGETSFKEIESKLGKGLKSKKIYKRGEVENYFFSNVQHKLMYPGLGIIFKTTFQSRVNVRRIAKYLELSENFPCRSSSGLGIGSTYTEIRRILGLGYGLTYVKTGEGEDYTYVSYSVNNHQVYLRFISSGKKSESEFRVEKIYITNNH